MTNPTTPTSASLREPTNEQLAQMAYELNMFPPGDIVPVQILDVLKRQYMAAIKAAAIEQAGAEKPADSAAKDERSDRLAQIVAEKTKQIDAAFPDPWGYQNTDARRYQRLQILGCAPMGHKCLENGTVLRFQTLDAFVDEDIRRHPSRGEFQRANDPVRTEIDLSELKNLLHVLRNSHGWHEDVVRKARLLAADALEQTPTEGVEANVLELKTELMKEREDRLNCARMGIDLGNKCDQLRQRLEAAQSADPLQGAVTWLVEAFTDCTVADIQRRLTIGYNRAMRLYDAAIAAQAGKESK